jgi:hypothetical protein
MVIDVILALAGVALLLLLTFGGLIATEGRKSDQLLVAPRGARFGEASRLTRKADRQRRLATVDSLDAEPAVARRVTLAQADRHAA